MIVVHAAVLLALARLAPEMQRKLDPVLVTLITPPRPVEPAPPPPAPPPSPPAKAQPKRVPAAPKPPMLADPPPTAISVEPAASAEQSTAPAPASEPVTDVPAATAPAPPVALAKQPAPVVPPRFDAAYLNNPRPEYPRLARRMGEQGKVMLRVYVTATGSAQRVEIQTSSGSPRLDQAARAAVERWKFVPARHGDEPIAAWVLVPITFVLEG